jgi:exosortase
VIAPSTWLRAAATVVVLLAQLPLCLDLVEVARTNPYAGHVMLVPALAAALLWLDSRELSLAPTGRRQHVIGGVLSALALILAVPAHRQQSLALEALSSVLAVAGLGVWHFGVRWLRRGAFVLMFLLLMIPPPPDIVRSVVPSLQQLIAGFSSAVLECLLIPVVPDGVFLRLPGLSLEVAEECAGLRFLFILVVMVAAFARFVLPNVSTQMTLIALSIPVAVLANATRVAITGAGAYLIGPEVATGALHYYIGKAFWASAFGLMIGFAVVLRARAAEASGGRRRVQACMAPAR